MASKLWSSKSYGAFLKASLTGSENRGRLSRAGEHLGVQRSYLSRVLAGELHLTSDHAYRLTEFFEMRDQERDYFLALVEMERASSAEYREFQKRRAQVMRQRNESIEEQTNRKQLVPEQKDVEYFSAWYWSAIHFLTSTPSGQTVEALNERLQLPKRVIATVLEGLRTRGYVKSDGRKWTYLAGEFHTPKGEPLTVIHHQNWRARAVLDAQINNDESIHFTAVQSVSVADVEKLREIVLSMISDSSRIAGPSKPEDTVVITCDFFRI